MRKSSFLVLFLVAFGFTAQAQEKDQVIENMIKEAKENSQLKKLAYEVTDLIGPRLVGTPQMQHAHDWAVDTYGEWGIEAENEKWGVWKGWERGVSHIDLVEPRVTSLEGMQLAWSPSTDGPVTAEVVIVPDLEDSVAFQNWLANDVKGKFVMISMMQPSGRPEYNWKEFATEESLEKMRKDRQEAGQSWADRIEKTGYNNRTLPAALEEAGAAGVVASYWSQGFGVQKIFGATTKNIPMVDIALEDYGMLYRMVENDAKPKLRINAESKDLGEMPTFNTVATIKGTEKPEEYIILSAHFDSWDGGTGATDNATGTIVMMEAMRILKKMYPNPKRTIIAGHWGSEEQGLNGSRAFVEDHPEIVENIQAVFNQDNGTGRVVNISGQGFLHSYEFINRWLEPVPQDVRKHIETTFPGSPAGGGSDYASFLAVGAPGFSLSSLNWSYFNYTWHTNRDTYDKIVFDDVENNVILTAILTYMASEDDQSFNREKSILPVNPRSGRQMTWPNQRNATRRGMLD
ncbi:M20/M25/M40 family metallo-hydrolase [Litoribacter populi]|uniref:M20/M25/M40 family metallo-hydrolase n=1 Tax=Litoribacter populi TaxID=2598460 RepID=UPI0011807B39|nr:M20/M25/M40 family metallo-hydrolase [Litoribacter populi]